MKKKSLKNLSPLELDVMKLLWEEDCLTVETVRQKLAGEPSLKDSTIRTVLTRLEKKGYVTHETISRANVYKPVVDQGNAVSRMLRQVIDRFCGGSVEDLLVGMVSDELVTAQELRRLAEKIDDARNNRRGSEDV
jgi:BlaI family transcriptional regulator, penicillinase repressor